MKIVRFTFNMFGENCYLVYDPASREAMVVDPGMISPAENDALDNYIDKENLTLKYLLNTHLHLDHCFGNAHITQKYGIKTRANQADEFLGNDISGQARMFGVFNNFDNVGEIIRLSEGDTLTLGTEKIKVIETPGHSPGGISLYAPADGWVITGDTLFSDGNVGRTDLPGGDYQTLMQSVAKLHKLPGTTKLLPGHGPSSTIADS
ncbi:MAG: MBL fold metallo-hydrolase [Bacteroides sp.]|nr:MBL fold metallo-hydrolase [Bacteroides sp.]MCM1379927.1 MBL fold metallo-hydrolase [Bacteroides sp.]MCM1446218.1 MBL fold metallo-hydrolase [Prevotella sp.]